MAEARIDADGVVAVEKTDLADLIVRTAQFETLLGVDRGELHGLCYCGECNGVDFQWSDIIFENLAETGIGQVINEEAEEIVEIDPSLNIDEVRGKLFTDYRREVAEAECSTCEGTGFEGGSWALDPEGWIELARAA